MPAVSKSAATSTSKAVRAAAKSGQPQPATTEAPRRAAKRKADGAGTVTPQDREQYIQVAAYYIAERDGFNGDPQDYWINAEQEIDRLLQGTPFRA